MAEVVEVTVKVGLQPADYAWIALIAGAIVFEFSSDDLLTHSAERLVKRHPVLTRLGILALAGHLAFVLPSHIDIFNAKNVFHRGIAYSYRQVEVRCRQPH